jgi:BTB/POZ domain
MRPVQNSEFSVIGLDLNPRYVITQKPIARKVIPVAANSFQSYVVENASISDRQKLERSKRQNETEHMEDSVRLFRELWESGQFSDFTITAGDQEFKVHKNVVGSRSPVFAAIFESDMKEEKTGEMEITDFNAETVERLLSFLYTGVVQEKGAMDLYAIASKYQVARLKLKCQEIIISSINNSNALEIFKFANLYLAEQIKYRAFLQIQQMFPNGTMGDELMQSPEQIETMVTANRTRKRKILEVEREYENVMKQFKKTA